MRITILLIVVLLCLTTLLPYPELTAPAVTEAVTNSKQKKVLTNTATDSLQRPFYRGSFTLLRLSAGKKWSNTKYETDSLQHIIEIRKKF